MGTPLGNLEEVAKGMSADEYTRRWNDNLLKIDPLFGIAGLDLQLGTLSDNEILQYNSSISKWENVDLSSADIASASTLSSHISNQVNPTSTDTTRNKHLSNNDYKVVYDHISYTLGNPHNITAAKVGNDTAQWNADKIQDIVIDDTDIGANKVLVYNDSTLNLEYKVINAVQLRGYDLDFSAIADGYILSYNSTTGDIEFIAQEGASTYLGLSDVSDTTYAGKTGYVPKVNATEDGLELGNITAGNVDGGDSSTVGDLITLRNDTQANWTTNGATVVQDANIALENRTGGYWGKIGNGTNSYSSLNYSLIPFTISLTSDKHKLQYSTSTNTYATVDDTLENIRNVTITSALNGQILSYNNSTTQWENNSKLNAGAVTFADASDNTKQLNFNLSGVDTATTRTITMPNENVDLSNLAKTNVDNNFSTDQTITGDLSVTSIKIGNNWVETTTSETLALTDNGAFKKSTSATAINVTVPTNASVAFPVGCEIEFTQYGAGDVAFVADSGVTINSESGNLKIGSQYSTAKLKKVGTDEWLLYGSLKA